MYYNKFLGRFVLDAFDYYLLSAFIVSYIVSYLKNYLSEEAKMKRLRQDLINKSRLIGSSKPAVRLNSKSAKIKKIYKIALNNRGGSDQQIQYELAKKIEEFFIKLALLIQKNERNKKVLNSILFGARLLLNIILSTYNIRLEYVLLDPLSKEVAIIAIVGGGTTGFVLSWFAVAATVVTPPTILSVLLGRSFVQQFRYNIEYRTFKNNVRRLLEDPDFEKQVTEVLQNLHSQINNRNRNLITLEHLNWNKNPSIREAAQQLGIFETEPSAAGPINLDTDPALKQMAEELGFIKKRNPKKLIKAKSTNLRDLLGEVLDSNSESDLNIIDVEVVKNPLRIKTRD